MTLRRAALYVGGASLLAAWFSSAASLSLQRAERTAPPADVQSLSTEALAADVQRQARRLRERLASAPVPQRPFRNPFAFRAAPPARARLAARRVELAPEPPPLAPAEPVLLLIGIAERRLPAGIARTAMIATESDELIMATVGDAVLGRYTVTAVGPDTAELTEAATGRTRRISLQ